MKPRWVFPVLLIVAVAGALIFRLPRLCVRPMHGDEAVHTIKFRELYEHGTYRYDPSDYHGPTLYYFTLISAWLGGARDFQDLTEFTFRVVSVVFGAGLVLLLWLVADGLGRKATLWAAVFTAISPAMVFYSRYYIHETMLVFFSFLLIASLWRCYRDRSNAWLIAAGCSAGLMHATKETCIFVWAATIAGMLGELAWRKATRGEVKNCMAFVRPRHAVLAVFAAAIVSIVFFSSFFTYPRGVLDSVLTYTRYLHRAGGAGLHRHPWWYYLRILVWTHYAHGPIWSEGLIVGLALVGGVSGFVRPTKLARRGAAPGFVRFLAFYTVALVMFYSAVPYKTPWCVLGFLHGMILLAGVGATTILAVVPSRAGKALVFCLLLTGMAHLVREAYLASFKFCADGRNPYVYAHPVRGVLRLAERMEEIALVSPEGYDTLVKIITPDYWPLPWYLRKFQRVGYWSEIPGDPLAPVIITSPELEKKLRAKLDDDYHEEYFGLRPAVVLALCVRNDLWNRLVDLWKKRSPPRTGRK